MVKQHRKSSSKSKKSKSKTNRRVSRKNMRGGDAGRYVMPPNYFGDVPTGYYAPGAPELAGSANQVSVSQGTVWKGGQYAGPNLYPMQGGDCGCSSKRNYKKKTRKMKGGKRKGFLSKMMRRMIGRDRRHTKLNNLAEVAENVAIEQQKKEKEQREKEQREKEQREKEQREREQEQQATKLKNIKQFGVTEHDLKQFNELELRISPYFKKVESIDELTNKQQNEIFSYKLKWGDNWENSELHDREYI